MLPPLWEL
jgi:hypothetical protein